jgi:hypothetical protein
MVDLSALGLFFWRGFLGGLSDGNRIAHNSGERRASGHRNNFRFSPAGTYHFLTLCSQSAPNRFASSFSANATSINLIVGCRLNTGSILSAASAGGRPATVVAFSSVGNPGTGGIAKGGAGAMQFLGHRSSRSYRHRCWARSIIKSQTKDQCLMSYTEGRDVEGSFCIPTRASSVPGTVG